MEIYLEFDDKGRLLIPKRYRELLKSKRVKLRVREDGVLEPHPVYDPLKLKGALKLPYTVGELEEAGEEHVVKRAEG
ncbi:MAG: hypothetical protein DRJ57_05885 [Thermoprotei archaeon]|nr:MAG: hypothetical protein DRJ57_05885 [Thermoprotei archaeon]